MSTIYGNPLLLGGGKKRVEWHQCPEAVRNYLTSVTYDSSDYSNSQIANYAPATPVTSNTQASVPVLSAPAEQWKYTGSL